MENIRFPSKNIENIHPKDRGFYFLILILAFAAMAVCLIVGLFFLIVKFPIIAIIFAFGSALVCGLVVLLVWRGILKFSFYVLLFITILASILGNLVVGWQGGVYLYLFIMIPAIYFNSTSKRIERIIVSAIYGGFIFAIAYLGFVIPPKVLLNSMEVQFFNVVNTIMAGLILGTLSYFFYKASRSTEMDLIKANVRLEELATRDSLTNLFNRRSMNELIESEYTRSIRYDKPFGLIMADIDGFKSVNDKFGHAGGDQVLIQLSRVFLDSLRQQDMVSRWGGEEFLMLLPETDIRGVKVVAAKLKNVISRTNFRYDGKNIKITLTFGGVICKSDDKWEESLLKADRALYFGKNHGKNQAVIAQGEEFIVL